jgi:hypothetical protein
MAKTPNDTMAGEAPKLWGVRDINAREVKDDKVVPRIHEAAPGKTYALVFNEYRKMPEHHARVFLRDPAFEVVDENEMLVRSLSEDTQLRVAPSVLAPHLVIANLDELTAESLSTRAAVKLGGTRFTSATPRDVMIAFLLDAEKAAQSNRRSDGDKISDATVDPWDSDDLKSALEREMAAG